MKRAFLLSLLLTLSSFPVYADEPEALVPAPLVRALLAKQRAMYEEVLDAAGEQIKALEEIAGKAQTLKQNCGA